MPSTTRSPPDDGERPSKRTKVSSEEKVTDVVTEPVNDDEDSEDSEDSEEEISQEPEVRASDLYLDTASAFQLFRIGLMLMCCLRLTGPSSTLTSRKFAQCRSRTSISMGVWFVENISRVAGAIRTPILIPYTRTTMSLSISRPHRQ